MRLRPTPLTAALTAATVVALSACSAQSGNSSAPQPSSDRAYHDHSSHDHGQETHDGEHGEHGGQHDGSAGHASRTALERGLLRPVDLPAGYISGAHHQVPQGEEAPRNAPGCAPLADVLQHHHEGQHADHPQVRATFSKSHFGPQISQTVVDYGTVEAAVAALGEMESVPGACRTYEHSTSPIGANRYRVVEGPQAAVPDGGVSVRLVALGKDFDGINWDVWTARVDSRVLTVALRTALGGDSADLVPAVREALELQRT